MQEARSGIVLGDILLVYFKSMHLSTCHALKIFGRISKKMLQSSYLGRASLGRWRESSVFILYELLLSCLFSVLSSCVTCVIQILILKDIYILYIACQRSVVKTIKRDEPHALHAVCGTGS